MLIYACFEKIILILWIKFVNAIYFALSAQAGLAEMDLVRQGCATNYASAQGIVRTQNREIEPSNPRRSQ